MNTHLVRIGLIAALAAACAVAWRTAATPFLAAYLAAWWFSCGLVMGGLANVWVHNLTGGRWGEVIRAPALGLAPAIWPLALLFLPLLFGMHALFPWLSESAAGAMRWSGDLKPDSAWFKSAWLSPGFFVARSLAYLAAWSLLAYLSRHPALRRSARFAAAALIVYGITVSLAAVDWIMSLMPLWYSSSFGMLAGAGQMLGGMALAVLLATRRSERENSMVFLDLGNLLLMYVMVWAYLAFTQFLIIWAENLPHEIAWYIARRQTGWLVVAWLLAVFHFFAPLLILLFRNAKEASVLLGWLAAGLLVFHLLDVWWMTLPSLPVAWGYWVWTAPLAGALFAALGWAWVAGRGGRFLKAELHHG